MASEQNRFLLRELPAPRRKRWGGCLGGLSCFGTQKGGKRVVPSRTPEANTLVGNQPNGPQAVGLSNQTTALHLSLLAPPSSPASFTNSALQSTAQSPNNSFLSFSASSPGGPSNTMFATGPYAHETQLVSPPVFSTFTTEPSTAPFTPPAELAHITTPSSPDVPFARFFSSKSHEKSNYIAANDLQSTYSLYPGSPASSLRSPISRTSGDDGLSSSFPDQEFNPQWDSSVPQELKQPRSESGRIYGIDTDGAYKLSQDSNFFCPATFAQFYLDQSSLSQFGGRLSVSRESDVYSNNGGNGHNQNRQNKVMKQDVEEIEAYRASFGFSADEIVTTAQYVEISSDVMEESFTITPLASNNDPPHGEETIITVSTDNNRLKPVKTHPNLASPKNCKPDEGYVGEEILRNEFEDDGSQKQPGKITQGDHHPKLSDSEDIFGKMGKSRSRKYHLGLSNSDAEVDYRRGRSLRERKGDLAWQY